MPFYYLSFCDLSKPTGQKFVGATVVEADDPDDMLRKTWENGTNPGGEVEFLELDFESVSELPSAVKPYLNQFVRREQVIADGGVRTSEFREDDERQGVCQSHNKVQ